MKKTLLKNILRIFISLGLLSWFLLRSDLKQIFASLGSLSIVGITIIYAIIFLFLLTSALKWHILIPQYKFSKLLRFTVISAYYSLILPGQVAGEVVKTFRLGRSNDDMQRITASVIFDKATGIIALLVLGVSGLYLTAIPIQLGYVKILSVSALLVTSSFFLFRYDTVRVFFEKIIIWLGGRINILKPLTDFFLIVAQAFADFSKKPRVVLTSFLLGFFIQAFSACLYFLIGQQLEIHVAFSEWLWITALLSIALFFPITIAGLGVREGLLIQMLGFFGVIQEKALALSFLAFSLNIVVLILGFILDITSDNEKKIVP